MGNTDLSPPTWQKDLGFTCEAYRLERADYWCCHVLAGYGEKPWQWEVRFALRGEIPNRHTPRDSLVMVNGDADTIEEAKAAAEAVVLSPEILAGQPWHACDTTRYSAWKVSVIDGVTARMTKNVWDQWDWQVYDPLALDLTGGPLVGIAFSPGNAAERCIEARSSFRERLAQLGYLPNDFRRGFDAGWTRGRAALRVEMAAVLCALDGAHLPTDDEAEE